MIHQIKAMHSKGAGLSIRAISREQNISRNTVNMLLPKLLAFLRAHNQYLIQKDRYECEAE